MTQPLTGSFVALITPMNGDGSIDHEGFRHLIEFQREHGTSALLIMGSSGEVSMLTRQERHQIVEETVTHRDGVVPQWYGCTGATTEATIDYCRHAAAAGADGAVVAAPPYVSLGRDDGLAYFLDVAEASPIPIGIYNNPPRVKTDLHANEVLQLANHPNVVILKESTARVIQVAQVLAAAPGISVMCCCSPDLGLIPPTMALGGHGTANVTGNLIPAELATISSPFASDPEQPERFRRTYLEMLPVFRYAYSAVNPVAVKSLMAAIGMPAGPLRKPLRALEGEALETGLRLLRDLGLADRYGYQVAQLAAV